MIDDTEDDDPMPFPYDPNEGFWFVVVAIGSMWLVAIAGLIARWMS